MKIFSREHVFEHPWSSVVRSQWQKYPNPHNAQVVATDVLHRGMVDGRLHSHRILTSDFGLADWVHRLVGFEKVCYASEQSVVDARAQTMEMRTTNLTFCRHVSMVEEMRYIPHPQSPASSTLMQQRTIVTVQGVPLTSYMEKLIVDTVANNAAKGRKAMDWVLERLRLSDANVGLFVDKLHDELISLRDRVEDTLISAARSAADELRRDIRVVAEENNVDADS